MPTLVMLQAQLPNKNRKLHLSVTHEAPGVVPLPGIGPMPPAVEVWSLHHWTSRKVPSFLFF